MLFFLLANDKMPTIVGILTFMSRKNFTLNSAEHEFLQPRAQNHAAKFTDDNNENDDDTGKVIPMSRLS